MNHNPNINIIGRFPRQRLSLQLSNICLFNSLLSALLKNSKNHLHLIKKSDTGVLTKSTYFTYFKVFPLVSIDFKIILFVYGRLHGLAPYYCSEKLLVYEPWRPLRSSSSFPFAVPQTRTETFVPAAFSHSAPSC